MHTDVSSKALSGALAIVKPALTNDPSAQVLLAAADGHLTLSIVGRDVAITTTVPAVVHTPGEVGTVHADLARSAKGKAAPIGIVGDGDGVVVENGIATRLTAWPLDDKPLPVVKVPADAVEHDPVRFDADVLPSVLPAVSQDTLRPALTGVLWHANKAGNGVLVATDSYRIHLVEGVTIPPAACLIPGAALAAVAAHHTGAVTATVFTRRGDAVAVRFEDDAGTVWTVQLHLGEFPAYHQLIPSSQPNTILFPRPTFPDAVRELAKVARAKLQASTVKIGGHDEGIHLTVTLNGTVIGEKVLPGFFPGALPYIAFNPDFLHDLVTGLATCTLEVTDPLKPVSIREGDDQGRTHVRLIMPVRVN